MSYVVMAVAVAVVIEMLMFSESSLEFPHLKLEIS